MTYEQLANMVGAGRDSILSVVDDPARRRIEVHVEGVGHLVPDGSESPTLTWDHDCGNQ